MHIFLCSCILIKPFIAHVVFHGFLICYLQLEFNQPWKNNVMTIVCSSGGTCMVLDPSVLMPFACFLEGRDGRSSQELLR